MANYNYAWKAEDWSKPELRTAYDMASCNGKVYRLFVARSNIAPETYYRETWMYDPATRTWERKADSPTAENSSLSTSFGNKIYCFGSDKKVRIYDTEMDSWSYGAETPVQITTVWGAIVRFEDKIWLINLNNIYIYDPATDSWTSKTVGDGNPWYLSATVYKGKIYAYTTETGDVYCYNPVTERMVVTGAPIPLITSGGTLCVLGGRLVYISGQYTVFVYDDERDTWNPGPATPGVSPSGAYLRIATSDDTVYALLTSAGISTTNKELYQKPFVSLSGEDLNAWLATYGTGSSGGTGGGGTGGGTGGGGTGGGGGGTGGGCCCLIIKAMAQAAAAAANGESCAC